MSLAKQPTRRATRAYDDFATRLDELQKARISALSAFAKDVAQGTYPGSEDTVGVSKEVVEFLDLQR